MKKLFLLIGIVILSLNSIQSQNYLSLPKIEILGKGFYYYDVKKGDSLYGICKNLGWNEEVLKQLNPDIGQTLITGIRLYYPSDVTQNEFTSDHKDLNMIPTDSVINHTVKRGETVYSISKLYNVPIEQIYAANPKSKTGIKTGEIIKISQNNNDGLFYYTIKPKDTLYGIAKIYNTKIEDILKLNPGVSETHFLSGDVIRIALNSNDANKKTEIIKSEEIKGFKSYKVGKEDTWRNIAKKNNLDEEKLRAVNAGIYDLKKNKIIAIPQIEIIEKELVTSERDPRENSLEGRREIYEKINNIESTYNNRGIINALILISDPASNRDSEFVRGFLLALKNHISSNMKINLSILYTAAEDFSYLDSIINKADIIFYTSDKEPDVELLDIVADNKAEIVNVFDLKSDLYQDNPSIIQLLIPSQLFTDKITSFIESNYGNRELIMIGTPDDQDAIANSLNTMFGEKAKLSSIDNMAQVVKPDHRYLIYGYPTKKEEVIKLLDAVSNIKNDNPAADIEILGRPVWISFVDQLGTKFTEHEVMIPSRFYLDMNQINVKQFFKDYSDTYSSSPLKSYPNYAATGYDVASIFIPALQRNGGDFNNRLPNFSTLQQDIQLMRASNWSGFMNDVAYIIYFYPGMVKKTLVR